MSGDSQTPYCTLTKHDTQETRVYFVAICHFWQEHQYFTDSHRHSPSWEADNHSAGQVYWIARPRILVLYIISDSNPGCYDPCEFRAVMEEKIEQRLLRLKKQMIIMLVTQHSTTRLWISRCGRRKNRATTAEGEETDDHQARNTMQHNRTVNFALWPKKKWSNDSWG
jgi:hypothetical protein